MYGPYSAWSDGDFSIPVLTGHLQERCSFICKTLLDFLSSLFYLSVFGVPALVLNYRSVFALVHTTGHKHLQRFPRMQHEVPRR